MRAAVGAAGMDGSALAVFGTAIQRDIGEGGRFREIERDAVVFFAASGTAIQRDSGEGAGLPRGVCAFGAGPAHVIASDCEMLQELRRLENWLQSRFFAHWVVSVRPSFRCRTVWCRHMSATAGTGCRGSDCTKIMGTPIYSLLPTQVIPCKREPV